MSHTLKNRIITETSKDAPADERAFEVVERKGIGHPDTICDSIMEAVSVALCREYMKEFGTVLHHNIDKGLLAAGRVERRFGGGRAVKPMELIIGDRATFRAAGRIIPVSEIAVEAAQKWIRQNLRFADPERHFKYRVVLAPGSAELTDIFERPGKVLPANDTSAAVGYYPLSGTEKLVLELEKYLNSGRFKKMFPETGEDVKVMGLREGRKLSLTVAMPLIASFVKSENEYFERKDAVLRRMQEFCRDFSSFDSVDVRYNSLDEKGRGLSGIYLSLLGTSAEDADSGQVGRGNRVNGLISVNRPMGTEAAAGKNPVSHVGKIYNVLAHRIARKICEEVEGVREAYVILLSRIGSPIDSPETASVRVALKKGVNIRDVSKNIAVVIEREFEAIDKFCRDLSRGKYPVC